MKKNIGNENHIIYDIISRREHYFWTIFIAILICLGLWVGGMFLTHWYAQNFFCISGDEGDSRALFGDSFGAVNALISAFAFAGVIVSMYLQRKDLTLQRKSLDIQKNELTRNTEELALQRKEFETQNTTMKLQRFENTFFNMMSLQQEIINSFVFSYKEKPDRLSARYLNETPMQESRLNLTGRSVFDHLYNSIVFSYSYNENLHDIVMKINNLYYFDHYFLHLYGIIKFVHESNILETPNDKYKYISMLRSTLSRYELALLFYNELNPKFVQFKRLIEEYSIFDNLYHDTLINIQDMGIDEQLKLYSDSAYDPSIKGYKRNFS